MYTFSSSYYIKRIFSNNSDTSNNKGLSEVIMHGRLSISLFNNKYIILPKKVTTPIT